MTDDDLALERLRTRIDAVDDALIALLAERAALVGAAWEAKDRVGVPRRDLAREAVMTARLVARATAAGLDEGRVRAVLRTVLGVDLRAR